MGQQVFAASKNPFNAFFFMIIFVVILVLLVTTAVSFITRFAVLLALTAFALSAIVGLIFSSMFLGFPLGGLALYYVVKAFRTRRDNGSTVFGLVLVTIIAVAAISFSGFMVFFLFYSHAAKK